MTPDPVQLAYLQFGTGHYEAVVATTTDDQEDECIFP